MSRSSVRAQEKLAARSFHARRSERIEQLKRDRDKAMHDLWARYQFLIDEARRMAA